MRKISLLITMVLISSLFIFGCKQQAKPKDEGTKQRKAADSATPPPASGAQPKAYGQKTPEPATQPAATPAASDELSQKLTGNWCALDKNSSELKKADASCAADQKVIAAIVYKKGADGAYTSAGSKLTIDGKSSDSDVKYDDTTKEIKITPKDPATVGVKEVKGTWDKDKTVKSLKFEPNPVPAGSSPPPAAGGATSTVPPIKDLAGTWCAKNTEKPSIFNKSKEKESGTCSAGNSIIFGMATQDKNGTIVIKKEGALKVIKSDGTSAEAMVTVNVDDKTLEVTFTVNKPEDIAKMLNIKSFKGTWDGKEKIDGTFELAEEAHHHHSEGESHDKTASVNTSEACSNTMCPLTKELVDPAFSTIYNGKKVCFCCEDCKSQFLKEPSKYTAQL